VHNIYLIELFDKAIYLFRGTKFWKLREAPLKLIYAKFLQLFAEKLNKPIKIKTKTFWNENMLVIIPEIVSLSIYRYGFFEEGLTRMVLEYLKPGMTFFDLGAHFGYYTLLASFIVGKKGEVHSFEPTPSSFNILEANALNKVNVVLNNCAVFSKKKTIFINDYGTKYSAFNSIYKPRLPSDINLKAQKYRAKSTSIDDYVKSEGIIPNFIKIDAESSEYEILLGMERTINNFYPIISIEVGDLGVKDAPKSKDLINFLVRKGYQPYEFIKGSILPHIPKNSHYNYANILFIPK
jgi:FkbM family methyltransferase